ncbi:transcriptional regulator [Flavobacterium sp. Sd200]|uniref:winged helix-turn-helix transcriptional regulator n=1 Tax=Flavobacterium sp. Sd200 TaxID=2692211 RepID=UPI00136DA2E7|nr:helix-turn-helix domain-containing protein [Flavobacterium sp. Sd200]MXN92879.1 transcriptional regulator [Flavobacterium sp. Sd200]
MTTNKEPENPGCPAEGLLKMLSGKFKPQVFRFALEGPVRFNNLVRHIEGANKQSVSVALRELEEYGLLEKKVVSQKPLHIEYNLTDKGQSLVPIFKQLEQLAD